mgnify:CR=1 FL=1
MKEIIPYFLIFVTGFCRGLTEIFFFVNKQELKTNEIFLFLSFVGIWYFLFIYTVSYVISFFCRKTFKEVIASLSKFLPIVILFPLIDKFAFGQTHFFYRTNLDLKQLLLQGKFIDCDFIFFHCLCFFSSFLQPKVNLKLKIRFLNSFLCLIFTSFIYFFLAFGLYEMILSLLLSLPAFLFKFSGYSNADYYDSLKETVRNLLLQIPIYKCGILFSIPLFFVILLIMKKDRVSGTINFSYFIPFISGFIFLVAKLYKLQQESFLYLSIFKNPILDQPELIFRAIYILPFVSLFDRKDPKVFFPVLSICLFSQYILVSFLIFFSFLLSFSFLVSRFKFLERLWSLRFIIIFSCGSVLSERIFFFTSDLLIATFFLSFALILNNVYFSFVGLIPFLISGNVDLTLASIPAYIICLLAKKFWNYALLLSFSAFYLLAYLISH